MSLFNLRGMMTQQVSGSGLALSHHFFCDWVGDLCKMVYETAMKILKKISAFFSSSVTPSISLNPDRIGGSTATAPQQIGISMTNSHDLVSFYRGTTANNNGVTLNRILHWDDNQLEAVHNYIQWLFPLDTPSGSNLTAPVLDQVTIQAFRNDGALRMRVKDAFCRMLRFYGLQIDDGGTSGIVRSSHFNARAAVWLTPGNHNFLRISRILRSLNLLGSPGLSRDFFNIMQNIYQNEGRGIIDAATFNYWQRAVAVT
jgi:hypothetical protein